MHVNYLVYVKVIAFTTGGIDTGILFFFLLVMAVISDL
ncbi:unnamed protein product [Staurois parvus]|uniref:Uncharacterized protein n=1 Tax=Staurois parvus TaxID=386267 RepID=A0ABN9CL91_9NEOB|nr:unnamed protein product [Staurois parvus]